MSEDLKVLLKNTVSEKRFRHSEGVANTLDMLLKHYNCKNYVAEFNGFNAAFFCGYVHDLARELTDSQVLEYCRDNSVFLDEGELNCPMLAHGKVAADMIEKRVGKIPQSWKRAIEIHTLGDSNMDDLALGLFCADFIEPSRTYLTQEQRDFFVSQPSIEACAYEILQSMNRHWLEKAEHRISEHSVAMMKDLEKRLAK